MQKTAIIIILLMSICQCWAWQEKIESNICYRYGQPYIPSFITSYDNPAADVPMALQPVIASDEYVPRGLYGGEYGDAFWDYSLTKLIERNGNSYYVNGSGVCDASQLFTSSRDGQFAIACIAARLGARVYFQNHSSEIWWPNRIGTGDPRQTVYNRIENWATSVLMNYVMDRELRQGILVWGLSEEIDLATAQDPLLAQCRNNIFKVTDPFHPAIVMLMGNSSSIQQELFNVWGDDIPIMVTDIYPNHSTVSRSSEVSYYTTRLEAYQNLGMQHDAQLWLILPCFSQKNPEPSQGLGGYRTLVPEELSKYAWIGLAYGASGFYLYAEYLYHGNGRAAMSRFEWVPSEEYMAATRFFGIVERYEKLIRHWSPTQLSHVEQDVAIGVMNHEYLPGLFYVVANTLTEESASYKLPNDGSFYYELDNYQRVIDAVGLTPGSGRVLFNGTPDELEEVKAYLGNNRGFREQHVLPALASQIWTVDSMNEETVASQSALVLPAELGGKGGIPWVYSDTELTALPNWAGELLQWDTNIDFPAGLYTPPRPGAGEHVIYMKWDMNALSAFSDLEMTSAAFELTFSSGVSGGRLAVYPVQANSGNLTNDILEFMPRWEKDQFTLDPDSTIRVEIGGMVSQWASGELTNNGILLVFNGWPETTSPVMVSEVSDLQLEYYRAPESCQEVWLAGMGQNTDINHDCTVDMLDFACLAADWLN